MRLRERWRLVRTKEADGRVRPRRGAPTLVPGLLAVVLTVAGGAPVACQPPDALALRRRLESGETRPVLDVVKTLVAADQATVDVLLVGAEAALEEGEWGDARSLADEASSRAPQDPRPPLMNGHALFRMAETAANRSRGGGGLIKATFLDAAAAYRTARELGGDPFSCAYFEAESLFWGEATARALEVVEVALGRDPESTAAALLKGRILLAAARPAEAAEVLAAARSRAQADPDLAYLLLRAVLDTGDRQRARDSFLELLETFPEDRELYDCFYVHFEGLQPGSFLQETLEEALRRRPPERDRFPLWYLGVLAESQGRLEEALARYTEYRDLRPTTPESDFQRGTVLTRMGRLEEARQALLRANALGGIPADQMAEGLRWLVAAQVQRQDFEAAARLQQVVFSLSLAAEDELNLGVLEFNAGRQEEGVRLYRRLLAREDLAPSMGAQAENYLGLALLGMGNATDAEAAFRRSIARDEAHLDALENLGALLVNQGRRGEAVPFLTRVLEEDGARQRSRYHLMRARHPHRVEALTERDR